MTSEDERERVRQKALSEEDGYIITEKGVIKILIEKHPLGPPQADEKHFVLFRITLNRVAKVDTANESVFLDFTAQFWWSDAGLVGKVGNDFDIQKIWQPNLEFSEVESIEKVYEPENCYWINDHLSEHGIVCFLSKI